MAKIAVIGGNGTIGRHIVQTAARYGHEVCATVTRSEIQIAGEHPNFARDPNVDEFTRAEYVAKHLKATGVQFALLAIPSGGDGYVEMSYIVNCLERGIRVVTAGKSALANQFIDLQDGLDQIGFDAAVGGGTMIPSFLREHLYVHCDHDFELTLVINGTLNYAQTRVQDGVSAEQICNEALRLGFAEPAASGVLTPIEMYRGEFADVSRKIAIICNTRLHPLIGYSIKESDLKRSAFTEGDLARVMAGNVNYRYLVRICTRKQDVGFFNDITIGGKISQRIGPVSIAAGFVELKGSLKRWVPDHVGNAVHLSQNGDTDLKIGQGAGPVPTVGAMMSNLRRFIEAR